MTHPRAILLLLSLALGCTATVAGAPGADGAVADHPTAVEEASPVDVPADMLDAAPDGQADRGSTLPPASGRSSGGSSACCGEDAGRVMGGDR